MGDWNIVRYDPSYSEPLDEEIITICDILNENGITTVFSCFGHGYDWPRIWAKDSPKILRLAKYIVKSEQQENLKYFTQWQKEVNKDGYTWMITIHCTEIFKDDPVEKKKASYIYSINNLTDKIYDYFNK